MRFGGTNSPNEKFSIWNVTLGVTRATRTIWCDKLVLVGGSVRINLLLVLFVCGLNLIYDFFCSLGLPFKPALQSILNHYMVNWSTKRIPFPWNKKQRTIPGVYTKRFCSHIFVSPTLTSCIITGFQSVVISTKKLHSFSLNHNTSKCSSHFSTGFIYRQLFS